MKYFKKISALTLCFVLSFNLVSCKSKDIKQSDGSNSAASCDSIDFSNINYSSYNLEGLTFNYPSFLGVSKKDDNYITFATQDNSVSLKVYKEKSGTNFRNLYNYDMSSLKNINYDSYKDIRFSISGTNNNFEYYKSSILLGNDIFSFMMIYPVEYLDEFDSIVTDVYKTFVANLDSSDEQNKDVANKNNYNNKLQVATIDETYLDSESFYSAKLVPLGDYIEGKEYTYKYCKILGTNIVNNKTINDPINYNIVYHYCGSIKYPDFMIPSTIPENLKNVDFISRDGQFYVNMGYSHNIDDYNLSSYLNNLKEIYNCLYNNIKDDKLYFAGTSSENTNKIILFCLKVNEYNILEFRLEFTKDYYYSHQETINSIFKEMDNSFYTIDTNNLP